MREGPRMRTRFPALGTDEAPRRRSQRGGRRTPRWEEGRREMVRYFQGAVHLGTSHTMELGGVGLEGRQLYTVSCGPSLWCLQCVSERARSGDESVAANKGVSRGCCLRRSRNEKWRQTPAPMESGVRPTGPRVHGGEDCCGKEKEITR